MKHRLSRGFTLIEIAVIVAVIAILAAITLTTYNRVQVEARDTKRSNDIIILSKALEKYYDQNGLYPAGCGGTTCAPWSGWYYDSNSIISVATTSNQLSTLLQTDLSTVIDPKKTPGPTATPIVGSTYSNSNATPGYIYRGGLTLNQGYSSGDGGILKLTEIGSTRWCTVWTNVVSGSAPPDDTMAFLLAYYSESTQTWQLSYGLKGAKPKLDAGSTPGFCNIVTAS